MAVSRGVFLAASLDDTRCFRYVDRVLVFFGAAAAYVSWNSFYMLIKMDMRPAELQSVLELTVAMFALISLLAVVHYRFAMRGKDGTRIVLTSLFQKDVAWLGEFIDAIIIDAFGNLSDAMGYVLVEVWYAYLAGREQSLALPLFFKILCVILLATLGLEVAKGRIKSEPSQTALVLITKVVVSGGSWFMATPLTELWLRVFRVEHGDAPAFCIVMLSIAFGVAWQHLVSAALARYCRRVGDTGGPLGEDVAQLTRQAMFYTAARLSRLRVLVAAAALGIHSFLATVLWTLWAVAVVMFVEWLTNLRPLAEGGKALKILHLRAESGAMYCRALAWMDSTFFSSLIGDHFGHSRRSYLAQALGGQIVALLLERFRLLRLLALMSSVASAWQARRRPQEGADEEIELLAKSEDDGK